eukprot:GDKH01001494.1.p1 GENE.GDKH01001494.1~~GDKH01001494.1.p1  ORF type:complete len:62 (+),score=1.55 GDKH01001494.1:22-207(+)
MQHILCCRTPLIYLTKTAECVARPPVTHPVSRRKTPPSRPSSAPGMWVWAVPEDAQEAHPT